MPGGYAMDNATPPATDWPAVIWPWESLPMKWSNSYYYGRLIVSRPWERFLATKGQRFGQTPK